MVLSVNCNFPIINPRWLLISLSNVWKTVQRGHGPCSFLGSTWGLLVSPTGQRSHACLPSSVTTNFHGWYLLRSQQLMSSASVVIFYPLLWIWTNLTFFSVSNLPHPTEGCRVFFPSHSTTCTEVGFHWEKGKVKKTLSTSAFSVLSMVCCLTIHS